MVKFLNYIRYGFTRLNQHSRKTKTNITDFKDRHQADFFGIAKSWKIIETSYPHILDTSKRLGDLYTRPTQPYHQA